MNNEFISEAIRLAVEGMSAGKGGPFGAVVVKNNEIIGRGCNTVLSSHDPTAHAEIVAIREACKTLNDFQLNDCTIYTTCEPCPMCMGAIYWARPKGVFFASTRKDAAAAGFDDSFIYMEIEKDFNHRSIPMQYLASKDAAELFDIWKKSSNKKPY